MANLEDVKKLYDEVDSVWPQNDKWHKYIHKKTTEIVEKWAKSSSKSLILNAGSGGTTYRINGEIYHVDLCENKINNFSHYWVGSIEHLPYADNYFDLIICVGSVLNYCDNINEIIHEFNRVLKPCGRIILEYEKSESAEFIASANYGKSHFIEDFVYNNQRHKLCLYSYFTVNEIMIKLNFTLKKQKWLHILSSIKLGSPPLYDKAARYAKYDPFLQFLGVQNSSNVICLYQKNIKDLL